jgi:mono/diheme cytochrome c family protein
MKTILFSTLVAFAACGGGGSKPATTPDPAPEPTEAVAKTAPPAEDQMPEPPPEAAPPDPKVVAMEAETAAYEAAKPVFTGACGGCHTQGAKNANKKKLGELDITSYPFTGKHAKTADIRKVLGIGGGKATMPKGKAGSVKGDDLAAIAAWADAYDAADAAGAHDDE